MLNLLLCFLGNPVSLFFTKKQIAFKLNPLKFTIVENRKMFNSPILQIFAKIEYANFRLLLLLNVNYTVPQKVYTSLHTDILIFFYCKPRINHFHFFEKWPFRFLKISLFKNRRFEKRSIVLNKKRLFKKKIVFKNDRF